MRSTGLKPRQSPETWVTSDRYGTSAVLIYGVKALALADTTRPVTWTIAKKQTTPVSKTATIWPIDTLVERSLARAGLSLIASCSGLLTRDFSVMRLWDED